MKLKITYMNGRVETYENVDSITPVKNAQGQTEAIVVDSLLRTSRLEPRRETEQRGIKSMEVLF